MNKPTTGKIIVLDGVDGCGKSTQVIRLEKRITEYVEDKVPIALLHSPGRNLISKELKELAITRIEDVSVKRWVFLAEWLFHYKNEMLPMLESNGIIILDRATPVSNLAYGIGDQVSLDECLIVTNIIEYLTRLPDLCIVLDIDSSTARERIEKRRLRGGELNSYDMFDDETFEKRREGYKYCESRWPWVKIINAQDTKEQNEEIIFDLVKPILEEYIK